MQMSAKAWISYITGMSSINQKAVDLMQAWIDKNGTEDRAALISYANSLVQHYGQAAGALSCRMYERTAQAQGIDVQTAEMAELPEYEEVGKAVNGTMKQKQKVSETVGRLIKQIGADTTLKNARRDGAQFAWVPHGDTCAFCITLASRGWQYMSEAALKGNHADHIHANCDCEYAIRFDHSSMIAGYDPDKYLAMYKGAKGNSSQAKLNALRRERYAKNRDKINAQKRAAYAEQHRRRIGEQGQEIIDKATYNKLTKEFIKQDGVIIRGEDARRHLEMQGAYASYMAGANVAFIRDDATVSDVLEEMHHAKQDRQGMFSSLAFDEMMLRREIEAQEYLLSVADKYKIPVKETETTKANLKMYEDRLRHLFSESGDNK